MVDPQDFPLAFSETRTGSLIVISAALASCAVVAILAMFTLGDHRWVNLASGGLGFLIGGTLARVAYVRTRQTSTSGTVRIEEDLIVEQGGQERRLSAADVLAVREDQEVRLPLFKSRFVRVDLGDEALLLGPFAAQEVTEHEQTVRGWVLRRLEAAS